MEQKDIFPVLERAIELGASDIHLGAGGPPLVRVKGEIIPLTDLGIISPDDVKHMIYGILYDEQKQKFEESYELDGSYNIPGLSRFRFNVHMEKNGVGAVLRIISTVIPEPEEILLGKAITDLINLEKGLVLVTGPTGSGKSTTLASLIELINRTQKLHILTIEDPIEFVYEPKLCRITQREVGNQTYSFANALRSAMRQDPDIILVGEMRDLETISLTLTAAETGHLVFATLHTSDAPQTIDRVVDVFPPYQQQQIRVQLAASLKAVICQTLLQKADGKGRVAAREILLASSAVSALIREGKTHQIYSAIETGGKLGMIPLDKSLAELVKMGLTNIDEARSKAHDARSFESYLTF
ncbi:MAG: type IV pilus twitching motility protein PilT [Candidatus Eremiobacteraeota bacterium]|nr:type IV pilus twitching motility protein PilT [Candidatus Eremiobacteraeota bacterium]